jgi:hypothetical protein
MDWFERITGFREGDEAATRAQLSVDGQTLVSLANGSRHGIGQLTLPSLRELRARVVGGDTSLLTRLGGGVFGNDDAWIDAAIERALLRVPRLDVRLVHYGAVPRSMQELARRLA